MNAERTGVSQNFATDLREVQERMKNTPRGLRRLFDEAEKASRPLPQNDSIVKFRKEIPGEYTTIAAVVDSHPEEVIKILNSSVKQTRLNLVPYDYALLAAVTLPDTGYDRDKKLPKLRNEEPDATIFRLAVGRLRDIASQDRKRPSNALTEIYKKHEDLDKFNPDDFSRAESTIMMRFAQAITQHDFADYFLRGMQAGYFTAESARAELAAEAEAEAKRERVQRLKEQWLEVFRVQTKGSRPVGEVSRRQGVASQRETISLEENPRVNHLIDLAEMWGANNTDPELAPQVRELRFKQGVRSVGGDKIKMTDQYYVAVLPQRLSDGRIVEHAIFDSDKEDNAVFVYRGEREVETTLHWTEVFDKSYKGDVVPFGAKKIIHKYDWRTRVLEYLTKPVYELPPVQI